MEDIEYLESYLITEHDATVTFGKDEMDAYYYDVNCIGISTKHTKEIQLFCLLHEAGHLILRTRDDFKERYPDVYKHGLTQCSRVDTVREEIDAWAEGKSLAQFLGIKIEEKKWNRYWKQQIYKYVEWAAGKGR